jgi:hypothetical protein
MALCVQIAEIMPRELTLSQLMEEINVLAANFGENQEDALAECDKILLMGIGENFLNSTTARGDAWPQRKDPTLKHELLILEGHLAAAATGKTHSDAVSITDGGKVLTRRMPSGPSGTSLAGRRRHEFGDEEILGKAGILARPYYGIREESADACAELIGEALLEQVAQGLSK